MLDTRTKLQTIGKVALSIEAQQNEHPDYANDILMSLVNAELRTLALESERYWAA